MGKFVENLPEIKCMNQEEVMNYLIGLTNMEEKEKLFNEILNKSIEFSYKDAHSSGDCLDIEDRYRIEDMYRLWKQISELKLTYKEKFGVDFDEDYERKCKSL